MSTLYNPKHRLSSHFNLHELVRSDTADRHGFTNWPTPGTDIDADTLIHRLTELASVVLEPVRVHYGTPIRPSSGFRCLRLNRLLRSSDRSAHPAGWAVDFEVSGVSNYNLAVFCENMLDKSFGFDQIILEAYNPEIANSGWVHVGIYRPGTGEQRRQCKTWIPRRGYFDGFQ